MLVALEILLLLWVAITVVRLLRWGPAGMLLDFGCLLGSIAVAWAAVLCGRWLGVLAENYAVRALVVLACGAVGFLVPRGLLGRWLRRDDRAVVRRVDARLGLGSWSRGLLAGLGIALFLGAVGFVGLVLVNVVAAIHPDLRGHLEQRGLALRHLLLPAEETAAEADRRHLARRMAEQRRLFDGAARFFAEGVGFVAERTGTRGLVERLRALRNLVSLDPDLLAILAAEDPALHELLGHPALLELIGDEAVLRELEAAGRGSLLAIYRLGEDARIKELMEDPDVVEALGAFDLVAAHRRADLLDERVALAAVPWRREGGATGRGAERLMLSWPVVGGTRCAEVDCVAGTLRVLVRSPLVHRVRVDGRRVPVLRSGAIGVHTAEVGLGTHRLEISAPAGHQDDRSAIIAVFVPFVGL